MKRIKYRYKQISDIIMISPTQTMENSTEVEYISIYDRPKRSRGRPKTCTLSDEEKRERLRANYKAYYYADPERERRRNRLVTQKKKRVTKIIIQFRNHNYFFLKKRF